ncbi:hypothetical protein C8Q70DRAFT_61442 [Cubamyces menziesii]|nr:hypothetical protein C8Q70DRAFT_61442 [Cubamyces menziesii]
MRTRQTRLARWNASILPGQIVLGSSSQGTVLQQYADLTGNSVIWNTNVTAGTSVAFEISDSGGNVSQTGTVVVHSSSDQSCLNDGTSQSSTSTSSDVATSTPGDAQTTGSTRPLSATTSSNSAQTDVGSISRSGTSSHSNPTSLSNEGVSLSQKTSSTVSTSSPVRASTGTSAVPRSSRSVGTVVGAAVGGSIGGLLLILVVVLLLRKSMRHRHAREIENQRRRPSPALLDTTEPFISIPEKQLDNDTAPRPPAATTDTNVPSLHHPLSADADPSPAPSLDEPHQPNVAASQSQPVVRRIRREVDAGSVHMDDASDGGGTLTLPPAYEDLPPRQRPSRRQGRK